MHCITCFVHANSDLEVQDLKSHYLNNEFTVVLERASQIRASKRTSEWKDIIVKSFKDLQLRTPYKLINMKDYLIDLSMSETFTSNKDFQREFHKFVKSHIKNFNQNNLKDLNVFYSSIDSHTKKFEFISLYPDAKSHIYFDLANSDFSDIYCSSPEFYQFLSKTEFKTFQLNLKCWKSFTQNFAKQKVLEDNSKITKAILKDQTLEKSFRVFIAQRFLLSKNTNQDTFNLAWESFKNLKSSSILREKTLQKFEAYNELPGLRFKQNDLRTHLIVKKMLSHFPEYIDKYLKTCFHYMSGLRKYEKGNPTPQCIELSKIIRDLDEVKMKPFYFTKIKERFPYTL